MLANIARQSVGSAYEPVADVWDNTFCWYFDGVSTIKGEINEALIFPTSPNVDELTYNYWFYIDSNSFPYNVGSENREPFPFQLRTSSTTDGILQTGMGSYARSEIGVNSILSSIRFRPSHTDDLYSQDHFSMMLHWPVSMAGVWTMITLTHDVSSGYARLYKNGVQKTSRNLAYTANFNSDGGEPYYLQVGGQNGVPFYITELGIWDETLNASNILELYNNGSPFDIRSDSGYYNTSDSLLAYYRFGDGANDRAKYGDELAVHGDMETFPTLSASDNDTWTDESEDGNQNVTMITETGTTAHINGGSKSAKITLNSTSGYITYNRTDYVSGKRYRAELYMRLGDSQAITAFQMHAGTSIRAETFSGTAIAPTTSFKQVYIDFTATAPTMMINCEVTGTNTHFGFIDDFSIQETPYLHNEEPDTSSLYHLDESIGGMTKMSITAVGGNMGT